jgi:hypothetical protein
MNKSVDELRNQTISITEKEWLTTPEAIADWLRWYDALEPVEMTAAEEADLQAYRQKIKEYTIAKMEKRIERLFP